MPLETNFNTSPYFDDFSDAAEYYKILFKPGVAVQVRELNQLQTVLQKQIERFGDHIFKSGTIISGVNFRYVPNYQFIKITDLQVDGQPVAPAAYLDYFVKNSANLQARVINYQSGFQAQDPDLNTLYVQYTNSGNTSNATSYANGETLTVFSQNNPVFSVDVNNGGSGFSNSDAVVFMSAVSVNVASGTFTAGEIVTQATTNAQAVVIESNTSAIADTTVLKIRPLVADLSNTSANSSRWDIQTGYNITGNTSGAVANVISNIGSGASALVTTDSLGVVSAVVINSANGTGSNYVVPPYVTVKPTSNTASVNTLDLTSKTYKAQLTIANSSYTTPVGNGYGFAVTEGIIYQKGHFLSVDPQVIIVSKYSNQPNNVSVGFTTSESIDDVNANTSLYDNAANTTNFNAPGADRLKLTPQLAVVNTTSAAANVEFFALVEFKDGAPYKENRNTVYNTLGNEFARRTQETNGDFVIDPFLVVSKDRDVLSTSNNYLVADPGLAYISGFRVQTLRNTYLDSRKATDTLIRNNQTITANYGNYVVVNELAGNFKFKSGDQVKLYDAEQNFISSRTFPTLTSITPTGNIIGTARIRSLVYDDNEPGTPNGQYRLYLFDVTMNSGYNFKSVRSVYYDGTNDGICDIVLDQNTSTGANVAMIKDTDRNTLVFDTGLRGVKVANDVSFTYRTTGEAETLNSDGTLTLSLIATGESFPYSPETNLTTTQKKDVILVPLANAQSAANLTGTLVTSTTSANVTGTSTSFISDFDVGDWVYLQANSSAIDLRRVVAIANNTVMTLDANASFANNTTRHKHFYPAFYPIPLSTRANRTVNAGASSTTLVIDIDDTLASPVTAAVTYNVKRTNATQVTKTINRDVYVKINTGNNAALATGPWCLGASDATRLKNVYLGNTAGDLDVTKHFFIDQGHDANHYGQSYLVKRTGSSLDIPLNQWLLVKYDAFTSADQGYHSVSSYSIDDSKELSASSNTINTFEIPEVQTFDGKYYDLRDSIEFRPFVANTVAYANSVAGAPINPANTETYSTDNKYFPVPDSEINFDAEVYMGRVDRVVAKKDGTFDVIEGAPSLTDPKAPKKPIDSITLALVNVKPYPSLPLQPSSNTVTILNKSVGSESGDLNLRAGRFTVLTANLNIESSTQPQTYTMNDIGNLERRIKQLEYYVSLTLLEQEVKNLSIPSSVDPAVNRFKNGFFVDDLKDYSFADQYNKEFKATISQERQILQPSTRHLNLEAKFNRFDTVTANALYNNVALMLPYEQVTLIEQKLATSTVGSDGNKISYAGSIVCSPKSFSIRVRGEVTTTPDPQPSGGCCFDPEAKVSMADGTFKRICDVQVGEKVINQTGGINTVLGIEAPELGDRLMYKFNSRWAFVSEEHPILTTDGWAAFDPTSWAVEKEFVGKLNRIDVGTTIVTHTGTEVVHSYEAIQKPADYKIYNLMLDGDHTYIVEDVVVHNKKIICTKLHEIGLMPYEIYKADQDFGEELVKKHPDIYYGYIAWAQVVVDWMNGEGPYCMVWYQDKKYGYKKQQELATKWAYEIATPWAEEMAYQMGVGEKGSWIGKALMAVGMPICKAVGVYQRWFGKSEKPAGKVVGYALWAVFGLLKAITLLDVRPLFKLKGNK